MFYKTDVSCFQTELLRVSHFISLYNIHQDDGPDPRIFICQNKSSGKCRLRSSLWLKTSVKKNDPRRLVSARANIDQSGARKTRVRDELWMKVSGGEGVVWWEILPVQAEFHTQVGVGSRPAGFGLLDLFPGVIVSFFYTFPIAYQALCLRLIDWFPGRWGFLYRRLVPGDNIIENASFLWCEYYSFYTPPLFLGDGGGVRGGEGGLPVCLHF